MMSFKRAVVVAAVVLAVAVAAAASVLTTPGEAEAEAKGTHVQTPPLGYCCSDLGGSSQFQFVDVITQTNAQQGAQQLVVFSQVDLVEHIRYQQVNVTNATGITTMVELWQYANADGSFSQVTRLLNQPQYGCWTQGISDPQVSSVPCFGGYTGATVYAAGQAQIIYTNRTLTDGYTIFVTNDEKCVITGMLRWSWNGQSVDYFQSYFFNQFAQFFSPIPLMPDPNSCKNITAGAFPHHKELAPLYERDEAFRAAASAAGGAF